MALEKAMVIKWRREALREDEARGAQTTGLGERENLLSNAAELKEKSPIGLTKMDTRGIMGKTWSRTGRSIADGRLFPRALARQNEKGSVIMADNKQLVVTREGLAKMKEELAYKETTEKMRIAEQLKVAISYGDLSENAEYDAAKNDQAALEQRITELRQMIENAVVVDESKIDTETVGFGTRVTIVDVDDEDEEKEVYTIVGTSESDPAGGRLSNESPVGAALIGGHVGDVVVAQTPGGSRKLRIIDIAV